jgi:signal peptidase I
MYPKLYVNDYLIVSKFDFGLRLPFTKTWILGPYVPKQNSIVVFLSRDESKYYIKRLVGRPGDRLVIAGDFILELNGEKLTHEKLSDAEKDLMSEKTGFPLESFEAFREKGDGFERVIFVDGGETAPSEWSSDKLELLSEEYSPPPGYILFMGDNRHRSHDGRMFGYMEKEKIVGLSRFVGLSCESKILGAGCDPTKLRTDRLLMGTSE